jgi:hypothetical protein
MKQERNPDSRRYKNVYKNENGEKLGCREQRK